MAKQLRSTVSLRPSSYEMLVRLADRWGTSRTKAVESLIAIACEHEGIEITDEEAAAIRAELLGRRSATGVAARNYDSWVAAMRAAERAFGGQR